MSEADRMARIRDLLVGPVIADESARRDQSIGRLDQTIAEHAEKLATLRSRLDDLQQVQRAETDRFNLRLLGIVEALLADENELRKRLAQSEVLKHHLHEVNGRAEEPAKSG
ncbi:MAG: hypothetical protein ACR2Q4_16610 [Geminicoccaceae bacterium]